MTSLECDVCCTTINKSTNSQVKCPNSSCNFVMCKKCVRYYLINSIDLPHCMNCKTRWGRLFTIQNLNKSFWDGDYMDHRKEILTEREISKIPETMEYAERMKQLDKLHNDKHELMLKKNELLKEINVINSRMWDITNEIVIVKTGTNEGKDRKKFIMACQNPDCNGFLSTQYKCEICTYSTCSKCLEFMGDTEIADHVCNEDTIKTTEEIRKTTKPCPNCSSRIFKISGCDQMWCVDCNVAFSWNSGSLLIGGVIHNPHYYEFLKNRNGGQVNRNPLDVPCGGLVDLYSLLPIFKIIDRKESYNLFKLHQVIADITYDKIVVLRNTIRRTDDTKDLIAYYILKKLSRKGLTNKLIVNDKIHQNSQEKLNVYELLSIYGIEFFRNIYDNHLLEIDLSSEIISFRNLISYCNEQFRIIGATYNNVCKQLDPNTYTFGSLKCSISGLKNIK